MLALAVEDTSQGDRTAAPAVLRLCASRPSRCSEAAGPRADRAAPACTKSVTTRNASHRVASEFALASSAALCLGPARANGRARSAFPLSPRGLPAPELARAVLSSAVAVVSTPCPKAPAAAAAQAAPRSKPRPRATTSSRACRLVVAHREPLLPRGTARGGGNRSGPLLVRSPSISSTRRAPDLQEPPPASPGRRWLLRQRRRNQSPPSPHRNHRH